MSTCAIILAAGKGTRMRSSLPKVMHRLAGAPMLRHVLNAVQPLAQHRVVVVAPGMETVQKEASGCRIAVQQEQLGTGHAVLCALDAVPADVTDILVVYADTPLLQTATLETLLELRRHDNAAIALGGMQPMDPTGYGRLVMHAPPQVERIVECKDASAEEKHIPWVWGGVMAFDAAFLRAHLPKVQPSAHTKEYYLTALLQPGVKSIMSPMPVEEAMGVNSRAQLALAEAALQSRLRARAMECGATLIAPDTVFFSADTQLGQDVIVHPFVTFGAQVVVENNVEIRSFCHIEGAHIGAHATIGPYARLRPGTQINSRAHVGNFVEIKQSHIAEGAKINHLSYVGDADVGAHANIGAGTITCNYDGKAKHRTHIGAHAFIGSNTSLVAPVTVGDKARTGAGSVITHDVPEGALAIARERQVNKN